ncbi:MAG: OB-fold nucleic acid binding domain-containing protein [Candidatus Hodarchaeota archaeon]
MSFYQNKFPAIRCMIKHVLEGQFSEDDVILYTIFGKARNVHIIGTIIEKREEVYQRDGEERQRIIFELDDGTGLVQAVKWDVNFEKYKNLKKGDVIDLVGNFPKKWKLYNSISINFLTKVEDPNLILLREGEVVKKIKFGEIQKIPDLLEVVDEVDEIYVDNLFNEEQNLKKEDIKENIYEVIEEHSSNGLGITFKELTKIIQITESLLKQYIKDLEMESRIYQSDNYYHSY